MKLKQWLKRKKVYVVRREPDSRYTNAVNMEEKVHKTRSSRR